jgi:hypothetical protein
MVADSGDAIVAVKPTNKPERSAAKPVERRAKAKGNAGQQSTHWAQCRARVAQALAWLRRSIAVDTRDGSHMRESCTYGSGAARLAAIPAGVVCAGEVSRVHRQLPGALVSAPINPLHEMASAAGPQYAKAAAA